MHSLHSVVKLTIKAKVIKLANKKKMNKKKNWTFTRSPSSSLHSSLSSANQFSNKFFLFWFTTRRDNSKDSKAFSFPFVKRVPKYCNSGGVCPAWTGTLWKIQIRNRDCLIFFFELLKYKTYLYREMVKKLKATTNHKECVGQDSKSRHVS